MIRHAAIALLIGLAAPALAQGAPASAPFDTRVLALKPGEFIWDERVAPNGPMLVIVNLKTQRAYAYRNGVRIGASTVSSGKPGKRTPTGVFTILQKNKDHRSNLYNSAPMPYMQRLTWDGIALHAGNLPGYPASHGCIRLPIKFAQKLFENSPMGMTVVVEDEAVEPETVADSAFLAPFTAKGEKDNLADRRLMENETFRWQPEKSPEGPVTIVISTGNLRAVVYRNGTEIGRSRISVPEGFEIGTRAAQFAGRAPDGTAQWVYLGLPGYETRRGQQVEKNALEAVVMPPQFRENIRLMIGEGTTVLATDGDITGAGTGRAQRVLEAGG